MHPVKGVVDFGYMHATPLDFCERKRNLRSIELSSPFQSFLPVTHLSFNYPVVDAQ